jgi:hypothetical protein
MDFVRFVEKHVPWHHRRQRILLDNSRLGPYNYPQDKPKSPAQVAASKIAAASSGVVAAHPAEKVEEPGALKKSVLWPMDSYDRGDMFPFLVASAAVIMSPVVDPELTYGAAVAAGYGAGMLANCLVLQTSTPPPEKKFILKKIP